VFLWARARGCWLYHPFNIVSEGLPNCRIATSTVVCCFGCWLFFLDRRLTARAGTGHGSLQALRLAEQVTPKTMDDLTTIKEPDVMPCVAHLIS
jgi:hypothetical protein